MRSSKQLVSGVLAGMAIVLIASLGAASAAVGKTASSTDATWGSFGPVTFGDMAFSPSGTLFVSDCGNARIYKVSQTGDVSVFAGSGPGGFTNGFSGDGGPAIDAHFSCPYGLAFDAQGNLYVADHLNNRIRRIDTAGTVTTVVGTGKPSPGIGFLSADQGKPATQANLYGPVGVSFDAAGNMYIGDRDHNAIRKVDTNGTITTVAGTGKAGYSGDGAAATAAQLNRPLETASYRGSLYLVDENNARIRTITNGVITTLAGTGQSGCSIGSTPAALNLVNPNSVALAADGSLYVTDSDCHQVRKIQKNGTIRPVVGTGQDGCGGYNGPADDVRLSDPEEVRFAPNGDLYVADQNCGVILRIDSTGMSHLYATAPVN
jgi:trimeric autotransporter adhesin